MTDEPNNETSEQPEQPEQPDAVEETAEGQGDVPAGPVAEDGTSSSQAAGDAPSSAPPAEDGSDEPEEEPVAESPSEEVGTAEESVDESAPESPDNAEEPAAEEAGPEQPKAEEKKPAEKKPAEKKADVIPGADLEPIAVKPEAPQLSAEEKARLGAEEEERARREAELAGEGEEPEGAGRAPAKMESGSRYLATGKRKTSIARVTLAPGSGKVEINKRSLEEFFPRPLHQTIAMQPLSTAGYQGSVDVRVRVHGGGISGQAGAVRHGIARALTEIDPELRGDLKKRGFLTRDARVKERRKAGLKKARKKPQFSKR
jgi:small subunit ribosomal protein S9